MTKTQEEEDGEDDEFAQYKSSSIYALQNEQYAKKAKVTGTPDIYEKNSGVENESKLGKLYAKISNDENDLLAKLRRMEEADNAEEEEIEDEEEEEEEEEANDLHKTNKNESTYDKEKKDCETYWFLC